MEKSVSAEIQIVLLKDDCQENQWPMARIVSIETDEKNVVCTVTLSVFDRHVPGRTQVLRRPITKIVMLLENNEFNSPAEVLKQNVQDGSQIKRHVINFVNKSILVIITLNFELFRININFFFIIDFSFSTVISLSVKGVLILSRIVHVYLQI